MTQSQPLSPPRAPATPEADAPPDEDQSYGSNTPASAANSPPMGRPHGTGKKSITEAYPKPSGKVSREQTAQRTQAQTGDGPDSSRPKQTTLEASSSSSQKREEAVGPHAGNQGGQRRLASIQTKQAGAPTHAVGAQANPAVTLATTHDNTL